MMRVWVQFRKGGRRWYNPVADENEAFDAVEEARIPTLEEMDKGLIFRYIHDYGLEVGAQWACGATWQQWKGEEGEDFKEYFSEMREFIADEQAEALSR